MQGCGEAGAPRTGLCPARLCSEAAREAANREEGGVGGESHQRGETRPSDMTFDHDIEKNNCSQWLQP